MRLLKLHARTALLTSAITVIVLGAFLAYSSSVVARLLRDEQRARAELQAINLAEQLSRVPTPYDSQTLQRLISLARTSRRGVVGVRVWERTGGAYRDIATVSDESLPKSLPEAVAADLRAGRTARMTLADAGRNGEPLYQALAPIDRAGRYAGAVEIVERLEATPFIAARYQKLALWMALGGVLCITLGVYALFRHMVYRPIDRLLNAMAEAEAGNLAATAPTMAANDEFDRLAAGYNKMMRRVRAMSEEREVQRQLLEQKVAEATAELSERYAQLESLNRELWETTRRLTETERLAAAGQTAAQFAHEVGTPLNLISGHVQLLSAGLNGDEKARARLETINVQIERIERIVRAMLDRTRPTAAERAPLEINAALERIFDVIGPSLDARGVRLKADLAPTPPILGASDRLQQVFINLINNALDAMPDGGELTIRTRTEADAPRVTVEVRDSGDGMTEAVRVRMFDSFFTTKGRGTGLGLVVVRQIVREHDGEIEAASVPGAGTSVRLTFPAVGAQRCEEA
jgi:signal transduction histidine kinase